MVSEFGQHGYMALILGGSSGLGLAAARKLASAGMGICIVHRNSRSEMKAINEVFEEIRQTGVPFECFNADASDAGTRRDIIQQLQPYRGRFRCLLHSIAKGSLKALHPPPGEDALSTDDIRITMDYMAYNFYDWTMAMREAKLFAGDARVMAFTSEGSHRVMKRYAAVASAKATLEALMRNMAAAFAIEGLRVNCIQAGITETASLKKIPGSETITAFAKERNPFQRLTRPEDVADVVYLLCKDEAAWINGSIIPADGGEHIC